MSITLYNTLTRTEETFVPLDKNNIRMYVCGPTVYDRPHIGNARAVVVYDVLYRLLKRHYSQVTYVRNITDVDDKIIAAAKVSKEPIDHLTRRIIDIFHANMQALHCLAPTSEPKATEHIAEMIAMIAALIARGNAYVSAGHVYFDVASYPAYGALAGRKVEDMIAGSRVEVSELKKHPADFVLWKPAEAEDDASAAFDSPWGRGRPGWHIECSAMSHKYLSASFDIHGGGADLMFPHHTNEIAQSCSAHPEGIFAKYWVHNGFLTVNGEKMSKSLGNFITVDELLAKGAKGEALRYVLLATHYRKPLDFNDKALADATKALEGFYRALGKVKQLEGEGTVDGEIIAALESDLNTPKALARLHSLAAQVTKAESDAAALQAAATLLASCRMLGFLEEVSGEIAEPVSEETIPDEITRLSDARIEAKKARNFAEADRIREEIKAKGYVVEDKPGGAVEIRLG